MKSGGVGTGASARRAGRRAAPTAQESGGAATPDRNALIQGGLSCLNLNLQRANRSVAVQFDRALAPAGLTSQRYSILMTLGVADEYTLKALADVLSLDRTTLIRNIEPLIEQGLARDLPPGPRNLRRLAITAAGKKKLDQSYPLWLEAHQQMTALFGDESYRDFIRKLRRVSALRSQSQT